MHILIDLMVFDHVNQSWRMMIIISSLKRHLAFFVYRYFFLSFCVKNHPIIQFGIYYYRVEKNKIEGIEIYQMITFVRTQESVINVKQFTTYNFVAISILERICLSVYSFF